MYRREADPLFPAIIIIYNVVLIQAIMVIYTSRVPALSQADSNIHENKSERASERGKENGIGREHMIER